ncbi:Tfp pilus assembly protein FimT/FimU [Shewanella intestini]|uniref:Type II secretion system protein n=1 Tax=Shewanella intestini TaxID=2017544 RepID=A0ABS5I420_9GAMM|nr:MULTISPECIES: type II secretion system protein [Shewanella]MBR9728779.1 type II secretion system protein [Shewanella intestini]MRG36854.1 MSHA biogenesis protein MshC [Shewanella sp. XMDDZSB0408]
MKLTFIHFRSKSRQQGVSLVELVTTILLIGIISVVVLPRLFSDTTYSAFTLRNEFISELRQAQWRAMNNSDRCYAIDVSSSQYQLRQYSGRAGNQCTGLVRADEAHRLDGSAQIALTSNNSQTFSVSFDSLGRVIAPNCNGDCFTVSASDTVKIAVSSEGYIHAL